MYCKTKRNQEGQLSREMSKLGDDQFYIELIEDYPCNSKRELVLREGFWIRHHKSWLGDHGYNTKVEGRTKQEYYQDRRDHTLSKVKEYYEEHKEERDAYKKQHYEDNQEHFKDYQKEWYLKQRYSQPKGERTSHMLMWS